MYLSEVSFICEETAVFGENHKPTLELLTSAVEHISPWTLIELTTLSMIK